MLITPSVVSAHEGSAIYLILRLFSRLLKAMEELKTPYNYFMTAIAESFEYKMEFLVREFRSTKEFSSFAWYVGSIFMTIAQVCIQHGLRLKISEKKEHYYLEKAPSMHMIH